MTEPQGPTPTGTSRPYRSLTEALRAHRIALENYEFITAVTDAVGISSYIDRGRYIEAIRRGEGAALHIGRTYTNGFAEDEVVTIGSTVLRLQPSEGREPYFFVTHPSEYPPAATTARSMRPSTPRAPKVPGAAASRTATTTRNAKPIERDYGVCDVCFMVKTAAGGCACD